MPLPIHDVLPELLAALNAAPVVVLEAPPGAGKTTVVPTALLDADWCRAGTFENGRVVMLEPRRLAARAAATRMAVLRGEAVGETVGYRVRGEAKVSARTRVEVLTEGLLTRRLHDDAGLDGVAAVVFDEFHERSLHADLALALTLDVQAALRPDLRIVVMSATLDARVGDWLGAPVVRSAGRMFPVETHRLTRLPALPTRGGRVRVADRLLALVAPAVATALERHEGDVLAFLPGQGEIRRVAARLTAPGVLPATVDVHALFGEMTLAAQDAVLRPAPGGRRKVVLATNVAQTSLTIEGVRTVIDGGFSRLPRLDVASGMASLVTVPVSQASADQRRGRAGRTAPGVCYRLWTAADDEHRPAADTPEILDADLASLALDLALWGVRDAAALRWLDPPPLAALTEARRLLVDLGALTVDAQATPHGRALARLGLHPRLGHLVVRGDEMGQGATSCRVAALLSERDGVRGAAGANAVDLRVRLEAVDGRRAAGIEMDDGVRHRVRDLERQLRQRARIGDGRMDVATTGRLVALAYPDRLAQRDPSDPSRLRLASGRRARIDDDGALGGPFVAVAHLAPPRPGDALDAARVALAAPISTADVEALADGLAAWTDDVRVDAATERVVARRVRRWGALVLADAPLAAPDPTLIAAALAEHLRATGLHRLDLSKDVRRLRERLAFLHRHAAADGWPDVSDDALLAGLETWLAPFAPGARSLADLRRAPIGDALRARVPHGLVREIDRLAPSHVEVPSGSTVPIDYGDADAPVLAVRLQEVFGLLDTPTVLAGRVPLVMHLLSPAHRPVQITRDLRSFWQTGYFDVRKDLRGRYPKHVWPDDPLSATPTRRAKPRGT